MTAGPSFKRLETFLLRIPSISAPIGTGVEGGLWWVKFTIDVAHPLAWRTVQELGHVLNSLAVKARLPTIFKPVSPPPYMRGGPEELLSWVIEATSPEFSPNYCADWLEGQLPKPVDDVDAWNVDDDDDD